MGPLTDYRATPEISVNGGRAIATGHDLEDDTDAPLSLTSHWSPAIRGGKLLLHLAVAAGDVHG